MASRASSSSSTEPEAPEVPGFRVGPLLGRGPLGPVHEAIQLGLDRRVALRLVDDDPAAGDRLRRLRWPEHDRAADLYAVGARPGGWFVARQLVDGPSLADGVRPSRALPALRDAAAALDAAHAAGIVHGSIGAGNVLVERDGRGVLCDFGLHATDATREDDLAAFAALVAEATGRAPEGGAASAAALVGAPPGGRRHAPRRRLAALAGVAALGTAGLLAAAALRDGGPDGPPDLLPGAQALGSSLGEDDPATLDCEGQAPDGASPACTIVQTRLSGRVLAAPRAGAVRRWSVRGARGRLVLTVLRPRRRGYEVVARSAPAVVDGAHVARTALPIGRGESVGVELAPGAGIGVRRDVDGAATARWIGPLNIDWRTPERTEGFPHELLLRVEYEPGATVTPEGLLRGPAAAAAPRGRTLATRRVDLPGGGTGTVAVVLTAGAVVVDLLRGERRLARMPVAGADPRGRIDSLETLGRPLLVLRWRNPDGRGFEHQYAVSARSLSRRR